jgi:hypothetical protein
MVHLTGRGGLVAPAGPLAVLVPQHDRAADPCGDGLGVADVQRQAGPAEAGAELPAAHEGGEAAGAGQQVHGRADDRPLEGFPGQAGIRGRDARLTAGACVRASDGVAELAEFGAQPDQVLEGRGVDVAGDDGGHGRVARDSFGSVAVQPGAAVAPGLGGFGAAGGPGGADLRGPFVLQGGAAVQPEQVGERDVGPDLDRLPGPLGQQVGSDEAAHGFVERVVVPLLPGPVILRAGRSR